MNINTSKNKKKPLKIPVFIYLLTICILMVFFWNKRTKREGATPAIVLIRNDIVSLGRSIAKYCYEKGLYPEKPSYLDFNFQSLNYPPANNIKTWKEWNYNSYYLYLVDEDSTEIPKDLLLIESPFFIEWSKDPKVKGRVEIMTMLKNGQISKLNINEAKKIWSHFGFQAK